MRAIVLLAALLLLPTANAASGMGTSSTGDVDTWGIMNNVPCGDQVLTSQSSGGETLSLRALVDTVTEPVQDLADDCLLMMCPQDIFVRTVRLTLVDPSPGDAVAIHVLGDPPGSEGDLALSDLGDLQVGDPVTVDPTQANTYPSAVATYDDPVAEVDIQLGGCNRSTTVVVEGIVVEGEVVYELDF